MFLDYVHALVRLPELRDDLVRLGATSDTAADTLVELERLSRSVSRLIGMVPDVLRNRGDVRHTAALEVMMAELTLQLDRTKPLAMPMVRIPLILMLR